MPSNSQIAQWQSKPSSAPKQVKRNLQRFEQRPVERGGSQAAPAPRTNRSSTPARRDTGYSFDDLMSKVSQAPAPHSASTDFRNLYKPSELSVTAQVDAVNKGRAEPVDSHDIPRLTDTHYSGRGLDTLTQQLGKRADDRVVQQQQFDEQQARDDRSDALGIATGALVSAKPLLEEMTTEQYEALNPRQRAAIDFNTMLATAVRKDKNRQEKYTRTVNEDMRGTYNDAVENMFGPDGGSDLYAPETMAVLRQLKVPKTQGADLDQYLQLQVAITEKDLKGIKTTEPIDVHAPDQGDLRDTIQQGLVDQTTDLQKSLAKGNKLLQDFSHSSAAERHDDLGHLGGSSPKAEHVGLGWDTPSFHTVKDPNTGQTWEAPDDMNSYFQQAFDRVADVRNLSSRNAIIANIRSTLNKPGEFEKFLNYSDQRTKNSSWYGAPLGSTEGVKYPSSSRARSALGLDELGGE